MGNTVNYPNDTIKAITEFLFVETPKEKLGVCDLTLVLGNDFIEGTMNEVRTLLNSGVIKEKSKIIISGATGSLNAGKEKECIRMYRVAVEKFGMEPSIFVLEKEATNSYQNLKFIKDIIQTDRIAFPNHLDLSSFNRILVIGKAFMMRRVEMCARCLGYPIEKLVYYPTVDREGRNIGRDSWWKTKEATERVFAEIERIGKYSLGGDLSIYTAEK